MKAFTAVDVAGQLGISSSRVRRLAKQYRIGQKIGRDWVFSPADAKALARHSTGKPGRPFTRPPEQRATAPE